MRKCLVAFALVVAVGSTAMAGGPAPCAVKPVCPPPKPVVCLPFTKKVPTCNPCDPCASKRVVVACPNVWGKIFGARHAPTVD